MSRPVTRSQGQMMVNNNNPQASTSSLLLPFQPSSVIRDNAMREVMVNRRSPVLVVPNDDNQRKGSGDSVYGNRGIVPNNDDNIIMDIEENENNVQAPILWNMEKSNCSFCHVELKEKEGIMLNACLHVFCRDCLTWSAENQEGMEIGCPMNDGSPLGCNGTLMEKELKALLSPAAFQKYVERSMNQAKRLFAHTFECRTPQCIGWCEFELGRKTFVCYVCQKQNCLQCSAIHDDGVDCEMYQKALERANFSVHDVEQLLSQEKKGNMNGWDQLQELMKQNQGNMEKFDLFPNIKEFDCSICMMEVEEGEGIILQDCLHMFCKTCLAGLVQHSDDPEVKCPFVEGALNCTNILKPREIKALAPADVYDKYLQRSVKLAESTMTNSFHCKTPDCLGWCEIDGGDATFFDCYLCKKRNCIQCKVIHHPLSCEDYKNRQVQDENEKLSEAALEEMVKQGKCMKCPKCGAYVEKLVGCDWLQCLRCRTELCWATKGPRWGPKGRGDTTGGCKCQLSQGKPCARNCQNCH